MARGIKKNDADYENSCCYRVSFLYAGKRELIWAS
jgi:hypothetical protein